DHNIGSRCSTQLLSFPSSRLLMAFKITLLADSAFPFA
ncbi:hypothetical protein A2U01_0074684, partial [Trifolium medium]|nr:hypothetical protein [Trifolium medium]